MEQVSAAPPHSRTTTRIRRFRIGVRRLWHDLGVARWAMVGLVLVGAGCIYWGSRMSDYAQSALLEIGAALILVVPLLLLERLMENRLNRLRAASEQSIENVRAEVEHVRQDVRDARTQIDELGHATDSRIAAMRDDDAAALRAAREDVTESNVWGLLHRALARDAIDSRGLRVRVPAAPLRLRFSATPGENGTGGSVSIQVERRNGDAVTDVEEWSPAEPADLALAALVADLQRTGTYPGSFDATAIFQNLTDALDAVLTLRNSGRKGGPLGRLVELEGTWAITDRGLEHLTDSGRAISARRLLGDIELARTALSSANGDEADATLPAALKTAFDYHSGQDRRAARARLQAEEARHG